MLGSLLGQLQISQRGASSESLRMEERGPGFVAQASTTALAVLYSIVSIFSLIATASPIGCDVQ